MLLENKKFSYKFRLLQYTKKRHNGRLSPELEKLIIRFAEENPGWGYDRISGALSNLGYKLSDQTVGNILKRNGIPPAPDRNQDTTWATFIKKIDFFSRLKISSLMGKKAKLPVVHGLEVC